MPRPKDLAPVQDRSRDTLERVLQATEELLQKELFEDLSMVSIADRAGVAVGTIYTRFKAKDDLLPALFERHDAAVGPRLGPFFAGLAKKRALRARIEAIVSFSVDYHEEHRGLLRALTMYVRAHPKSIPAKVFSQREAQYSAVAKALVGNGQGIRRKDPLEAALFGLSLVNSVCREQVLFDDSTPLRNRSKGLALLKRRLTDMLHRDLSGRVS